MIQLDKDNKIHSSLGILFQIPIWLIAMLGVNKILSVFTLSFTSYNVLEAPKFIGLQNYLNLSNDALVSAAIVNTVMYVLIVGFLLIITAVIPALLIARLPLLFGICVMAGYSFVSLSAVFPSIWGYIFSGDIYGLFNSFLAKNGSSEAVIWCSEYPRLVCSLLLYLICLAPVFVVTFVSARFKKGAVGSAIAICSIPILMAAGSNYPSYIVGYPSTDYSAEWLPTLIYDYSKVRYEVGFSYALTIVGLFMILVWCAVVCGAVFGINLLFKNINPNDRTVKALGFSAFGIGMVIFLFAFAPSVLSISNAFKPLDELFVYPPSVFVKRPTLQNFTQLFAYYEQYGWSLSENLSHLWKLFLVYIFIIVPCAITFSLFKICRRQSLLLLPIIGLLPLTSSMHTEINATRILIGDFISGFSFAVLLFVTYLAIKMVMYPSDNRNLRIALGVFCLITSFFAVGSATLVLNFNYYGSVTGEYSWYKINSYMSSGGIARLGVYTAGDLLMCIFTVATAVIPIVLMIILFLQYKKALNSEIVLTNV